MKKIHLMKIQSSLIDKFSANQELLQVKFINCYLREIIRFSKKNVIRGWGQSRLCQKIILADRGFSVKYSQLLNRVVYFNQFLHYYTF